MEEIWKDIEGYEGFYKISNFGNVLSLNYGKHGYAKQLVPKVNNSGRLWVELAKYGDKRQFLIHRLVGNAFIPNPDNLPQINHKDENIKNNCVENLEWCTNDYNLMYTYKRHPEKYNVKDIMHGGYAKHRRNHARKNESRKGIRINQLDSDGNIVKCWDNSRIIFVETGMSDWSISECCRGKRKTAYGFRWQYAI